MSLDQALLSRADRGSPIGPNALIERVRDELAAAPGVGQDKVERLGLPRRRAALVFAAAFVVVIAAIGAIYLLPNWSADEPAVTTTVPVTTVVPDVTSTTQADTTTTEVTTTEVPAETTTTIPQPPSSLDITWRQVASPVFEGGWIAGITQGGSGLIAVGGTRSGDFEPDSGRAFYQAGVWLSSDGVDWTLIDSPDFRLEGDGGTGNTFMVDIVEGPSGFVGVGWARGQGAIWVSPDGWDWQRVRHDDAVFGTSGEVRHVVRASFGLVAVGVASPAEGEEEEVVAWVSGDGQEWTRSPIGIGVPPFWSDPLSVASTRLDVIAWDDLVVVVGALDRGEEWTYRPAIWITEDGVSWETITDGSGGSIPVSEGDDAMLAAVAPHEDGLVAIGWLGDVARGPSPAVWTSQDGRDWEFGPGDFYADDPGLQYAALVTAGNRIVLASSFDKEGRLFASADGGASWFPVGDFGGGGLGVEEAETEGDRIFFTINDLAVVGDAVIASGRTLAYSGGGDFEGRCMWDPGDGSAGACRTDVAMWIGTWEE